MEPLLPTLTEPQLVEQVVHLVQQTGELQGKLNEITRRSVAEIIRGMNSYYSNLIEGHKTTPAEIEKALKKDFSKDPYNRALQIESLAHINLQKKIEAKLRANPALNLHASDFLCWVHEEFYKHLPNEIDFRRVKNNLGKVFEVIPGQLRDCEVEVGQHLAPAAQSLPEFLHRFDDFYHSPADPIIRRIIAIPAAHHRLLWIHPFLDGNGRVVRLFTQALLAQQGLDGGGLWAISRGLARKKDEYQRLLAQADAPRSGDLDGRGNLSDKGLADFCRFFFQTASDQVSFMNSVLTLETLADRIAKHVALTGVFGRHSTAGLSLLHEALFKGEFQRGEAPRITNRGERVARDILKMGLEAGLLVSDTEKRPVRLGFPAKALEHYFPLLFPQLAFA